MESNMEVSVSFLPGTEFREAVIEANRKARQWDVAYVHFSFNGVQVSVSQRDNVLERALSQWNEGYKTIIC